MTMLAKAPENLRQESDATRSLHDTDFPYDPIDCTSKGLRLIIVMAGEDSAPLMCTLIHEDLASQPLPMYETISYCWGNASVRDILVLNDTPISVPASAAAALRRIRLADSARTVWLDAVCINQNDISERNQQVAMMGDIYRGGSCNLIYLGEYDINETMTGIKTILHDASEREGSYAMLRNEVGAWQYSSIPMSAEYDVEGLIKFFEIPWFR
jgi:hypothetical protein